MSQTKPDARLPVDFYGECCGQQVQRVFPKASVTNTNQVRVRCPECGDPVVCHRGSLPDERGPRAVIFPERPGRGVVVVEMEGES